LKNGAKVAVKKMDHMESVSIGIWIRAGGRYEVPGNSGISHLLEHLLFKGTKKRDMKATKEAIEGKGGSFNGFTSEEFTCYLVKLLAKDAELGVDILSDMVLNPKMDEKEIEKEKNVIVEEINMYKDMPSHYVHEILAEMMWPDQPLGMPLAGTVEGVRGITRDELLAYKDKYYNPSNMLFVVVGKADEPGILGMTDKYLGKTPSGSVSNFEKVKLGQKGSRLKLYTKDTEQTHVALGFHSLDRFHPDRHAMSMANIILGSNMSSRLFHIVRDEMALCYEISSSVRNYEDSGALVISAGVDHKKLIKSIEVILRELKRMKSELVGKDELARAKEYYRGQLLFALEDTMSHMLWLGEKVISGEKERDIKTILSNIDKVTADDIMRVSGGIFTDDNMDLAIISPLKDDLELKEVLRVG
jgi:predicted Zn-dependent peptidase